MSELFILGLAGALLVVAGYIGDCLERRARYRRRRGL